MSSGLPLAKILAFDPRYRGPKRALLRIVWLLSVLSPLALVLSVYLSQDNRGSDTNAELNWEVMTFLLLGGSFWTASVASVCALVILVPVTVPARAKQSAVVAVLIAWVSFGILFRFMLHGKLL